MFIALRAGKFDEQIEGVPTPVEPPRGRAPMESTVSIEVGNEAVTFPKGGGPSQPGVRAGTPSGGTPAATDRASIPEVSPAPAAVKEAEEAPLTEPGSPPVEAPPSAPAPISKPVPSRGLRNLTPPPKPPNALRPSQPPPAPQPAAAAKVARPPTIPPPTQASGLGAPVSAPVRSAWGAGLDGPGHRPASIIPPAAKPLAPAPPPSDPGRGAPQKSSGLLAALGALSTGGRAPSLGASHHPSGTPPRGVPAARPAARGPGTPPNARSSSLDLDLQALERAAEQGNSPVYRQVRDFPAPPQALRSSTSYRSLTPPGAGVTTGAPSSNPGAPNSPGRYAPLRPAAIFGASKPQEGSTIFGEDLISEKSLDEVILSYLAEDLDTAPKK